MHTALHTIALSVVLALPALADGPAKDKLPPERIQWYATLASAKVEAARTGRPILLTAARPACRGVPGFW